MEMLKFNKCGLFALSFVLLFTVLFAPFLDNASAAVGDAVPRCDTFTATNHSGPLNLGAYSWRNEVENVSGYDLDNPNTSYVVFRGGTDDNSSGQLNGAMVLVDNTEQLRLGRTGNDGGGWQNDVIISNTGTTKKNILIRENGSGINYGNNTATNVECIQELQNTVFMSIPEQYAWTGTVDALPAQTVVIRPTIKGDVRGRNLSLVSPYNELMLDTPYTIKWVISKGDVGCNPETTTCEPLYFLDGNSAPNGTVTAVLPENGTYIVSAIFQDMNGIPFEDDPPKDYQQTNRLFVVDGSTFSFNTDNDTCDANGVCTTNQPDTGNPIVKLLNSLTIDSYGLQSIINAPLGFLASLPGISNETCQPIQMTLPFLNGNISYPCLTTSVYQPHFPALLTIWQTIMTALVAYWIGIKLFATVKNVNSPDNDRIEVVDL
jgi:hypothetical protein